MTVQLQIVSDLHLEIERSPAPRGKEFYHFDVPVCAPHLALLGDIGWTLQDDLFSWLKVQLNLFETVFFVSGNHEPYRSSIAESENRLVAFASEIEADPSVSGKFAYLSRTRYDISPMHTILGCTLWSALNPDDLDILSWSLTDFRRIENFNPDAFIVKHQEDLDWLNNTVDEIARTEPDRKVIVFTHHAPTIKGTGDPKFDGEPTSSAFATEITAERCWNKDVVELWAFGHTHWCCDFEVHGVRVYSNQRGYKDGSPGFEAGRVVTVG
ncbi:Ser/Thr protein phosphatase protein [Abortiporus biennis]|nr:Ser/Thr protein phosphatase protein [Abortiporus biennis]